MESREELRRNVADVDSSDAVTSTRHLRRRLHLLAFVDEFAPFYALFTLWFTDNGVSTSQISVAFVVWAIVAVLLEIPSGALADRVDRRKLIGSAFALRGVGISLWLIWPTTAGLVAGAALWALHDAAASGAWEAMIHDQLDAEGQALQYGRVMARVGQFSNVGLAAGTLGAAGLVHMGAGIDAVGWINVAAHVVAIVLVLALPDASWISRSSEPSDAWWATLRSGVRTATHEPRLRRLTVLGGLLGGLFVVDEYIPLLARTRGASDAAVPLIVLAVWLGLLVGGEVAARHPQMRSTTLSSALLAGTAVMAVAIAIDSPWALAAVGIGYGATETTWVISDARFQATAPRATRATVTSVRSLGEGVIAGGAFLLIALAADGDDPTPGLHWVIGLLALVSYLVWRWVPEATTKQEAASRRPT